VLDFYKDVEGVPIYIRPLNLYDRIKNIPFPLVRKKYKCFISENTKWKSRVKTLMYNEHESANYDLELIKIVIMGRSKSREDKLSAENTLSAIGVKLNPYGSASDVCFGFYLNSFDEIDDVVRSIKDKVDAVAIVNTVWYIKYGKMINLKKLIDTLSFTPHGISFKTVSGVVNYSAIRVFYNGTTGVYSPYTESSIKLLAEQIYSLFRSVGAFI